MKEKKHCSAASVSKLYLATTTTRTCYYFSVTNDRRYTPVRPQPFHYQPPNHQKKTNNKPAQWSPESCLEWEAIWINHQLQRRRKASSKATTQNYRPTQPTLPSTFSKQDFSYFFFMQQKKTSSKRKHILQPLCVLLPFLSLHFPKK